MGAFWFWDQVKECKVKKVKEMNTHPFACLDNMLLAERSFVSREDKPAVANGYRQEWMEKITKNASPSQDMHSKVDTHSLVKLFFCITIVLLESVFHSAQVYYVTR